MFKRASRIDGMRRLRLLYSSMAADDGRGGGDMVVSGEQKVRMNNEAEKKSIFKSKNAEGNLNSSEAISNCERRGSKNGIISL